MWARGGLFFFRPDGFYDDQKERIDWSGTTGQELVKGGGRAVDGWGRMEADAWVTGREEKGIMGVADGEPTAHRHR